MSSKLKPVLIAFIVVGTGSLSGCGRIDQWHLVQALNKTAEEAMGALPRSRILSVNQKALGELTEIDVTAHLAAQDIQSLLPDLVSQLNAGDDLKKQHVTIDSATITPSTDELTATISGTQTSRDVEIKFAISADGAPGATGDTVYFGLHANVIKVTGAKITSKDFSLNAALPALNAVVKGLLPLMNIALDRVVNAQKALGVRIIVPPLLTGDIKNFDTKDFHFASRPLNVLGTLTKTAVLVDDHGIVVMATAENKPPAADIAGFPTIDDLSAKSADEVQRLRDAYRSSFVQRYQSTFGSDAADLKGKSFVAVTKPYLSRTLQEATVTPAICGSGGVSGAQPPFDAPINLPAPEKRQCDEVVNSCRFKDICESRESCVETVNEQVTQVCQIGEQTHKVCQSLPWPINELCKTVVDPTYGTCSVTRSVTRNVSSPICEAYRQTKAVDPTFCNIGSNIDKAKCDTIVAADKAFCQAEEAVRVFAANNPMAVIHGTVTPAVSFDACVSAVTVDPSVSKLTATLSGKAQGPIHTHLQFENKAPAGIALCHVNWAGDFDTTASTQIVAEPVSFDISGQQNGDNLDLAFRSGDHDLSVNFQPAPITTLFGQQPQLLVNCTPILGLAAAYIAYDTVVNEQAKKWSPLLSGDGYKLTAKDVSFKATINPLLVKDHSGATLISLFASWRTAALVFAAK